MYECVLVEFREREEKLAELAKNQDSLWVLNQKKEARQKRKEARQTIKDESAGEEVWQSSDEDQSLLEHEDDLAGKIVGPTWKQLVEAKLVSTEEVEKWKERNSRLVEEDDIISLEE